MPKSGCKESLSGVQVVQIWVDRPLRRVFRLGPIIARNINVANVATFPITGSEFETKTRNGVIWSEMIRNLRVSLLLPLIPKVIEIVAIRNHLVIVFDLTI